MIREHRELDICSFCGADVIILYTLNETALYKRTLCNCEERERKYIVNPYARVNRKTGITEYERIMECFREGTE